LEIINKKGVFKMAENNTETTGYKTTLAKMNDLFFPQIVEQLENNKITFSQYAKSCTINAISAINSVLDAQGISWSDPQLDRSTVTQILLSVATLQLNPTASPREVYFQIRNVAVKDADGKTSWKKKIEMGIEGDGYDSLLSRFGRNVKTVYPYWLVRENDDFTYPAFNGLDMTPPQWIPKGNGKVVKVVYPIQHTDGAVNYYIAEREDVKKNLIAHISNNLMNETFGIITGKKKDGKDRTRYDATEEEKTQIAAKKKEILTQAKALDLEALLDSDDFDKYISPAWKEEQSREQMIIRKMRNNIVKKIPKDFSTSLEAEIYSENSDETYRAHRAEMIEAEVQPLNDVDFTDVDDSKIDKSTGEINQPEF
jgi:hypothetical protein